MNIVIFSHENTVFLQIHCCPVKKRGNGKKQTVREGTIQPTAAENLPKQLFEIRIYPGMKKQGDISIL